VAAQKGDGVVVQLLINSNCKLNKKSNKTNRPLHYAARNGYNHIVTLLIKAKCKLDPQNMFGDTPLLKAVQKGNKDIVNIFLSAGCHMESPKKLKIAQQKHPELASLFSLEHLASLWPRAHQGLPSPLQHAIHEMLCITSNVIEVPKDVRLLLVQNTIKLYVQEYAKFEMYLQ